MSERPLTVLIVSDAAEDRAALHDALSRDPGARYVIIEAESGARALELCHARLPDCLILGDDLADLHALDVLKKLAAEEGAPACAVIVLVGAGDTQLAVEVMRSGAHDCLEKGRARGEELRRAVSRAIERAEQRRQDTAHERDLVEKNRALEASLAALRLEAAGREQGQEAWQVARANVGSQRVVVSSLESVFNDQAEEQLRVLKPAIEQSNESVIITTGQLDPPGPQIIYVNPAFTKMTGYAPEEAIGKTPGILFGLKTDRSVLDRLRADCAAGKVFHGEMINYRKDRSEIYVEWNAGPVRNVRGEVTHFAADLRDLTERHRVEEAHRDSETQLRAILDHSAAVVFVKDLEGRYLRINRRCEVLFGVTETEVIGKTDYEIFAREVADVLRASDQEVIAANMPFQFEERFVTADGLRDYICVKFTLRDGSGLPYAVCGITTDITELKQVEKALRDSEERFRSLIEQATDGIFVANLEGKYTDVNTSGCEMLGYTREELLAMKVSDLVQPEDSLRLNAHRELLLNGEANVEEWLLRHKDGHYLPTEVSAKILPDGRWYAIVRNITDRKQVEEALKLSEERLNMAMQAGGIGISDWYIRDDLLVWSEKYTDIYGLPSSKTCGRYEDWRKRVYPEDLPAAESLIWGTFEKKLPHWHVEYRIVKADDGEVRWIESNHRVFYDAQGAPLRTVGVALDITDRILAEEAIRESEARFRQLADAIPQIAYTCRPDGMVDYANLRWYEYSGVSLEQSIGDAWTGALHPDDRERTWLQWVNSVKTGQPYEIEFRLRRKDGQYRWHLSRATPIRDERERIVKWIGTSTEIHDRKEAEAEREELLAREQTARSDAENTAESIRHLQMLTDSALAHLALDDLPLELLGRIRELLEADSAAILLLTEDGQSLVVRATIGFEEESLGLHIPVGRGVAGSIAASRIPLVVEDLSKVEVINPVLRRKARSLVGAPLFVEDRLIGVIHAETIRARRFTEEDVRLLQMAADRVALAIEQARLYKVEQEARRQAEEASRMKDEFLALVSHELRSPLNAMLGYASMLRRGRLDSQGVKKATDVIERSGKAQMQLIDDLLDTARIISGKLRLEVGPVDLVVVIKESVQTISPAAEAKGISIQTDITSEVGQITGDPSRLQQVVWNLLSNAVKFTPPGGRIRVCLERIDPHVCITVSDTGKGVSPDFLPYIFDRFRQADESGARRYGGLGLGLALVKYLVELHGGTVEVASAGEGQGATFIVTLPVRAVSSPLGEAGGAPCAVASPEEAEMLAGVRVLVVDDEDDARELIKMALEQYGADVVTAGSAVEAYDLITSAPARELPAVMLIDIGMPDEDGYSLMRRVRELERDRDFYTTAVALTAYGRTEDRLRALKAGFKTHVAKPVDPAELAIVIASLISGIPN